MLATTDAMEIKLRRLGGYRHFARTGDAVAFARVLAVKPPGMNTDVLPDWMVEDATKFSAVEHSRSQRLRDSPRAPTKTYDQTGRGRGGRGRWGQEEWTQEDGDGRGRGGRRGRGRGRQ